MTQMMIDFQEALSKVLERAQPTTTKKVKLDHLLGYCLAERILATCDLGQEIVPKHTMITPPVIGILAAMGLTAAQVYRKPKIAIIVTGDELVEPGKELKPGQIYDSNSYAVKAAVQSFGIEDCQVYHATDDLNATKKLLSNATNQADVVISTGGVSMGDFDYVKDAAEAIGFETIFWKIAVKPGKPVYFARLNNVTHKKQVLLFGLPGNPVATLVILHKLVKPALLKIMGTSNYQPTLYQASLKKPLKKKSGRMEFVRAIAESDSQGIYVEPTYGQDSHMLSGLAKANSLIHFVKESEQIVQGQTVQVEFIKWSSKA